MNEQITPTYTVAIHMAGDIQQAKQICRQYCLEIGLCVTVEPVDYVYTGGEESGFRIGFINYPRFPQPEAEIWDRAATLADRLIIGLAQHSYSIIAPDKTLWRSRRATS